MIWLSWTLIPAALVLGALGTLSDTSAWSQQNWFQEQVNLSDEEQEEAIASSLRGIRTDFLLGASTSAYQTEGAWDQDGRQPSSWDVLTHKPGSKANGDIADDFYHKYEQDIKLLKSYGLNSFRFSISWTRVFIKSTTTGRRIANPAGVAFYKQLLACLQRYAITPMVTMLHWDAPTDVDWSKNDSVSEFVEYASFLFDTFPEVKHWITFNEPTTLCVLGYDTGWFAPGRHWKRWPCGHHVLLAHGHAVNRWRQTPGSISGQIGISLSHEWVSPLEDTPQNWNVSQLDRDFNLGWFADPIYLSGDYPASMREKVGHWLPNFTNEEKALIKGSYHGFFGLNSYTAHYIFSGPNDSSVVTDFTSEKQPIGPVADSKWLRVVPWAMPLLLDYVNKWYKPSSIIITENGCDVPNEANMPLEQALNDTFRKSYFRSYLSQISLAVQHYKIPLQGYFAWSLLDNFEWKDGYTKRFGLTHVDFDTLERHPKDSAKWFANMSRRIFKVDLSIAEFSLRGEQQPASAPVESIALCIALTVGLVVTMARVRRLRRVSQQREPLCQHDDD